MGSDRSVSMVIGGRADSATFKGSLILNSGEFTFSKVLASSCFLLRRGFFGAGMLRNSMLSSSELLSQFSISKILPDSFNEAGSSGLSNSKSGPRGELGGSGFPKVELFV